MSDIKTQLRAYLETTPEVTFDEIMAASALDGEDPVELVRPRPQGPARWRGPLVAFGTAVAIVVVVAALLLVLRGGSIGVSDTPVTETSDAVIPPATTVPTTATTVPRAAGASGAITIVVTDLTDAIGNDLSGVLMSYEANAPGSHKWDGVAGLATTVDTDPFSTSQTLGEVTDGWTEDPSDGLWPWPKGTASVPAGNYTLWLWTGKDYCCYSRWAPAASPGLRGCELHVSTTGQDQTIYVEDIPLDGGPCTTDPATATTGTITIEMDGVSGMEGYELLAGVLAETPKPPLPSLVGGALWTTIDTDPFSDSDRVHPTLFRDPGDPFDIETWPADAYFWDTTAQLSPGKYLIYLWANPGELRPAFGTNIPGPPIDRSCTVEVEVTAGQNTTVVITGIPTDGEPCETATESNS